jgi:hypothetical protein
MDDAEAISNRQIFLNAVSRAKEEAAARKSGRVVPVRTDDFQGELARLEERIRAMNSEIASAQTEVNCLRESKNGQVCEAGALVLREGRSETVRTLSAIADHTDFKLKRVLERLTDLSAKRFELQQRRRELISGKVTI